MEPTTAVDLLEHRDFVRAVVRGLLADEHAIDDVVQETCLRALERPPRALRGWLASVARNLALTARRREKSRDRRERNAARPERQPSAAEAASRLERHRLVVEAVLGLEEPFRSAILLRFYDDLPPRAIARELGVPVETVRSRLRRGLEKLRAHLDTRHGGDRAAWSLALLPLAGPGGLLMSAKTKLSIAAVLLCVAAVGTVTWRSAVPQERAARSASARPAPEVEGVRGPETAPDAPLDSSAETNDPAAARADPANAAAEPALSNQPRRLAETTGDALGALRILVRDEAGGGMPDVNVAVYRERAKHGHKTGPDGAVEVRSLPRGRWHVATSLRGRHRTVGAEVEEGRFTEVVVVFARGAVVEGEVRHVERGPLADVGVAVEIGEDADGVSEWFNTNTDAHGRYQLEGLPVGRHPVIVWGGVLGQDQHPRAVLTVPGSQVISRDLVVGRVSLRGTVRGDPAGAPVAGGGVTVLMPPHQSAGATTRADGTYEILDLPPGKSYAVGVEADGFVPRASTSGTIPADGPRTTDFHLRSAAVLLLEVLDLEGRAVRGQHQVTLKTADGQLPSSAFQLEVGESGVGRHARELPGVYELRLTARGYAPRTERIDLRAGENRLTLRLEPAVETGRVSLEGVVRDATTRKPVAGARVRILKPYAADTTTGADGVYRFRELKPGAVALRVRCDGYGVRDVEPVEIAADARTLDVDLDPAATLLIETVDRTGAPVRGKLSVVIVGRGGSRIDMSVELEADADGRAAYRQLAPGSYALVVSQPGVGEARVEAEIAAGENVVRVRLE